MATEQQNICLSHQKWDTSCGACTGCSNKKVLCNLGNFHLQLLRHFKDIAIFVVGSFSLLHPVGG